MRSYTLRPAHLLWCLRTAGNGQYGMVLRETPSFGPFSAHSLGSARIERVGQRENRDFALEQIATDLHAVLSLAGGKRVVLVGHSIGDMINLTFRRLYPELVGSQVAGIVQLDTSYTNPVKTTKNSGFSRAVRNR